MDRLLPVELPKYLDVLLLINDVDNRTRINRVLKRSETYINMALESLQSYGCITVKPDLDDSRAIYISLTSKGRDVKKLILKLCNCLDIKVNYGWSND